MEGGWGIKGEECPRKVGGRREDESRTAPSAPSTLTLWPPV